MLLSLRYRQTGHITTGQWFDETNTPSELHTQAQYIYIPIKRGKCQANCELVPTHTVGSPSAERAVGITPLVYPPPPIPTLDHRTETLSCACTSVGRLGVPVIRITSAMVVRRERILPNSQKKHEFNWQKRTRGGRSCPLLGRWGCEWK